MQTVFRLKTFFIITVFFVSLYSHAQVKNGAERMELYLPIIEGKRIALVVNQTSMVGQTHLLDTLLSLGMDVKKVFAPEHGFRGDADAGAVVKSAIDTKTGIPLVSIYGRNKKPSAEQLADVDMVIFDIQDVGARFYTYISTMHYVMEACAEDEKRLLILDRPNPNDYVEGPVLKDPKFRSFVGMHPIPVLHGCTVGELARMINGEAWLTDGMQCEFDVIPIAGWQHGDTYNLPIKPSPNLPTDRAIRLYPSLCLFEGTDVSVGRGTRYPFEVVGYPDTRFGSFSFVPQSIVGMDVNPLQKGKRCYGLDLREDSMTEGLDLAILLYFYEKSEMKDSFFTKASFFDKLAGTDNLRKQIIAGCTKENIQASWQRDLDIYKSIRAKYLLYSDSNKEVY